MLHIVGLGPGSMDSLTLGTVKLIKKHPLFLRTEMHPTVEYLKEIKKDYISYDQIYDSKETFEDVYEEIKEDIIKQHEKYGEIVYAVPGHPLVAEKTVSLLIKYLKEKELSYKVYSAVSFIDVILQELEVDPIDGLLIIDALNIENEYPNFDKNIIITQVYSKRVASNVKVSLGNYYNDEDDIFIISRAGTRESYIKKIKLYELDRVEGIDHLTSVFIPKVENNYGFYDFIKIIEKLRDKDKGCPWDIKQTHESLKKNLIEESYELVEAIDKKDFAGIEEELGDVLLQVALHSTIGNEAGDFSIHDVIKTVSNKMIYRHPHVFDKTNKLTETEIEKQWSELKQKENGDKKIKETLSDISSSYPSLLKAELVQKKVSISGLDLIDLKQVFEKLEEELYEMKEEVLTNNKVGIEEEFGDLIFSLVNLGRFLELNSELALAKSIDKFRERIYKVEELVLADGLKINDLEAIEYDKYWQKAKNLETI
ncbi:MAG: nucleoside triphosphate pyrophosphohydrolase [Clostridium sp.]|nr:nucleoside triphosphate pyrophosphohydrolase [Clostridium sp.]